MKAALPERTVLGVTRQGKRIIIDLRPPARLVIHLGMTGRLVFRRSEEPSEKHTHLRLRFVKHAWELRFIDPRRFGGVWFMEGAEDGRGLALRALGPDALTIRVPVLRGILRRRRQIKAVLLDQQAISGLGNIYTDEALFAARIHPAARACGLNERQVRALACAIRRILRASIAHGGTTMSDYRDANGAEGAFWRRLRVYGREGEPCLCCRSRVRRMVLAGRSTHFCSTCQSYRESGEVVHARCS